MDTEIISEMRREWRIQQFNTRNETSRYRVPKI